jgi:hypothetical protein
MVEAARRCSMGLSEVVAIFSRMSVALVRASRERRRKARSAKDLKASRWR